MRKLLFVLVALSCTAVYAEKIKVSEEHADINGGKQNALTVTIPDVEKRVVEKEWCRLMKGYDAKVSDKKEIFADNALIKTMSANTVDVYAKLEETKEGIKLSVGFDLGGAYLSSKLHPAQYAAAEKIMTDFARDAAIAALEEKISDEGKKLKDINGKQSDLVKSKDKMKSNIEKWKEEIKDAEKKIEQNDKDQDATKKAIEDQQKVIDALQNKKKNVK